MLEHVWALPPSPHEWLIPLTHSSAICQQHLALVQETKPDMSKSPGLNGGIHIHLIFSKLSLRFSY